MIIRDVMTKSPVTVTEETSVTEAKPSMNKTNKITLKQPI